LSIAFNLLATSSSKTWHFLQRLHSNIAAESHPTGAATRLPREGTCPTEARGNAALDHERNSIRPWVKGELNGAW